MKTLVTSFLFSAAMLCLQGCVTSWVVNEYGKKTEFYHGYPGPVYGDTSRIYFQGLMEVDPHLLFKSNRQLPAYVVLDLEDGKMISQKVIKGRLPAAAFEYPEIKPLISTGNQGIEDWDDIFIKSELEMAFVLSRIYIKNPHNPNKSYKISVENEKIYPRSTSSKIALPFLFLGAVPLDCAIGYAMLYLMRDD